MFLRSLFALLLALVGGSTTAMAQFRVAELRALSRSGGQLGTTFDLRTTSGSNLEELDTLYFSHPAIRVELATLDPLPHTDNRRPDHGNFKVTIPGDVPPGRYEVRAGGRNGVSNPRAFLITPLVNQTSSGVSHDLGAPTPLPLATIIHASATAADVDYYALKVEQEQPLRIDLVAQQLDSRMIGQIKLFDTAGRLIAGARGADDVDPAIELDKLAAGDYVLAVHDFTYRGGNEYYYQVVARSGEGLVSPVDAVGPGQLPRAWATRAVTLAADVTLAVDVTFDAVEAAGGPESIEVPGTASRWFEDDGVDNVFEFAANEGETFSIDLVSHRLGEPTDARMMIQRMEQQASGPPKLHDVLNVDDSQAIVDGAMNLLSKDPIALFKSPATANYRISVRDLDTGQTLSTRQRYQLRIRPANPGFDLIAYRMYPHRDVNQTRPFGSKLFRGGAELIRVMAIRRDGWSGPIRIAAEGLPDGVSAREIVMGANQTLAQLTLTAAEDAVATTAPFRVVGRSEDDSITAEAVPAVITWAKGGGRDFIRSRIASSLYVAVSDRDTSPVTIALGDAAVTEVKKGASVKLPVKLTRREGGKTPVVVRPRDLPPGVTAGDVTIAADKDTADYELKIQGGAAPGTYSIWLQAETKIKIKPNPQALQRAQQYRAHLQTLHDDPAQAAKLDAIKAAIVEADKAVEAAKAAANDTELTVFLPTTNATIRVVEP